MNLRIPGPTPLPPETIAAVGQQMINHRGPEFQAMFREITEGLQIFFETNHDVYILTSSGTGAMEAAVVNTLSPGDRVLATPMGVFSDRFAKIAESFGADVTRVGVPMGKAIDPNQLGAEIAKSGPYKAVLLTQNETSTGVTNDMEAICAAIRQAADPAPLILVDGISGLGAIRLPMDAWGVDVLVSGSQKAWMAPPGLAFIGFNDRAWQAYESAKMPRHYFDLGPARSYAKKGQTPATPTVSAMYGLRVSLRMMLAEGVQAIEERHVKLGAHCRQRAQDLDLGLYADPEHFSNTVTAVTLKPGLDSTQVLARLSEEYDIIVGSSKDPDVDMIRIGHMGYVTEADIDEVFEALAQIMSA